MIPSTTRAWLSAFSAAILGGLFLFAQPASGAQSRRPAPLQRLKVSPDKHFLLKADGTPFFYLGDTAWELFHRTDRKQAAMYLQKRAEQNYTVIQAVAVAELNGPDDPNSNGDLPFIDRDPVRPAVTAGANPANAQEYDYWDHVEYIVDEANRRGLYIGFLPTWGRWVVGDKEGKDKLFTPQNAQAYGEFLGKRFGKKGIIWILGGDRTATGFEEVWRALARGIAIGVAGKEDYDAVMMSFHPRGGETSSTWFHNDAWLDFNMHQTGHGLADTVKPWLRIAKDYQRTPVKPVMDAEPLYEDHPLAFRARELGYSFDAHVRQRAYWDVFSGVFGHTYGNHSVWQMYAPGRRPVNGPLLAWYEAIHRPGAAQMQYVRTLIESRPMLSRVPDQSIVTSALEGADYIAATRGDVYLFVYTGQGRRFTVNLGKISGARVKGYWYNPRTGTSAVIDTFDNSGTREFVAPAEGFGADWVLVLDDASKDFGAPGVVRGAGGAN
ncbi:MAG: glycoside hydrolase family 140 protein [Bryobacterales bacterium]|nr:glycoside hydrolase family 140 protein [Bryobacterales bacterium]